MMSKRLAHGLYSELLLVFKVRNKCVWTALHTVATMHVCYDLYEMTIASGDS